MLWGPNGQRETYSTLLRSLIDNPDVGLYGRINDLYSSTSSTGLLSSAALKRRKIICYRAVWAIATLVDSLESSKHFLRSMGVWAPFPYAWEEEVDILHFARSVQTMVQWQTFQDDKRILQEKLQYLAHCQAVSGGVGAVDLKPVVHFLHELRHHRDYFVDMYDRSSRYREDCGVDSENSSVHLIPILVDDIQHILNTTPYLIMFAYLRQASELDALPYLFRRTISIIRPPRVLEGTLTSGYTA
ncbi:hypothetical protein DFH06DRAFT_1151198 [Mycena polygramma]|nr:hypothetical protein DFH06DRAFT_1151198 [Mycena polygramma]